jgi:hypothetical protein
MRLGLGRVGLHGRIIPGRGQTEQSILAAGNGRAVPDAPRTDSPRDARLDLLRRLSAKRAASDCSITGGCKVPIAQAI